MSDTNLNINISARDQATAQINLLQNSIKALEREILNTSRTGLDTAGAYAKALQGQIAVIQTEIAALQKQRDAFQGVTNVIKEQTAAAEVLHRTLQQGIDASIGSNVDRAMKSAAESARILTTSLSAAAEADARFRDGEIATAAAVERTAAAMARQGEMVRTLSGEQFFGVYNRKMGVGQTPNSAAESAAVFERQLGPAGQGITSVGTQATINTLQGTNRELLSAAESAKVFAAALGPVGLGITAIATKSAIDTIHGINREMLSASESAAVFQRELGPVTSALTLTPASGFHKMVAELAGVKQSYLSAAESAKVFMAAGLTPIEAAAAKAGGTAAAAFSDNFVNVLQRESRHIVGLFDSLMRGQKGQALSSIGAGMRDAGLGAVGLLTSLSGLVAIIGSVTVLHGAENWGKWATELKASASAAGMSVTKFSELQFAMTGMGFKAGEANAAMTHFARSLGDAIANPTKLTAQAFHNLGISQQELNRTGGDARKGLDLLAEAYKRTADSGQKTDNLVQILGEHFSKLVPLIQNGSSWLDQWVAKQKAMGRSIDEDGIQKLEAAGTAVRQLGEAITDNGMKAFIALSPTIQQVAKDLTTLVNLIGQVASGFSKLGEIWDKIPVPDFMKRSLVGLMPGGNLLLGANNIASSLSSGSDRPTASDDPLSLFGAPAKKVAARDLVRGGGGGANKAAQEYGAEGRLQIAEADGNVKAIEAIYDEWLAKLKAKYGEDSVQFKKVMRDKIDAVNKFKLEAIKADEQAFSQQQKLQAANTELSRIAAGGDKKQQGPSADIAQAQSYINQAQQVQAQAQAEIAKFQEVATSAADGSRIQKQAQDEIMNVLVSSKEREVELYRKAEQAANNAAEKIAEPFKKLFDTIGSQFESMTSTLVQSIIAPQVVLIKQGLTTIKESMRGQEIRQAASRLFVGIAQDLAKSVQDAIGKTIANAISGGAANTIGELLSQAMGKVLSNITGNVIGSSVGNAAGSAVGSTAVVTAIGTAATAQTTAFTGAIAAQTAANEAAIVASTGAIVGAIGASATITDALLTALNLKPSVLGFSYSQGGIVPSAAGGMVVGGNGGQLSILHSKEMVLPAPISQGLQQMIARGGQHGGNNANLNFSPTINTGSRGRGGTGMTRAEFMQMISLHSGSMLGEARNMMRSGWRPA